LFLLTFFVVVVVFSLVWVVPSKIVGANEGLFVQEMVALVAESCGTVPKSIAHTVRTTGKWTSLTVYAPVQSAEMLYSLYEIIDKDPRVRFKF
jgi:putative lipoic acid-binding regulatory protein